MRESEYQSAAIVEGWGTLAAVVVRNKWGSTNGVGWISTKGWTEKESDNAPVIGLIDAPVKFGAHELAGFGTDDQAM